MDNKIFDVNGEGISRLTQTIALAMGEWSKIKGYRIDKKAGLILLWHVVENDSNHIKFPSPTTAEVVAGMVYDWVMSKEALDTPEKDGWDRDAEHDGSNNRGWRCYVNDWGHINLLEGSELYGIVAIKPAYIWCGK
jgi:hypothetical protein